jgi:hypothetical protein
VKEGFSNSRGTVEAYILTVIRYEERNLFFLKHGILLVKLQKERQIKITFSTQKPILAPTRSNHMKFSALYGDI